MIPGKFAIHLGEELRAVGLGDHLFWNDEGMHGEENLSEEDRAKLQEILDAHDPDKPPKRTDRRFSKRMLFGALTDQEYAVWEQVEAMRTPREQRMLREAVELAETDPDWPDIYMAMVAAYGEDRAEEVLQSAELP